MAQIEFESEPLKKPEANPTIRDVFDALRLEEKELADNLFARFAKGLLRLRMTGYKVVRALNVSEVPKELPILVHHRTMNCQLDEKNAETLAKEIVGFCSGLAEVTYGKDVYLINALETAILAVDDRRYSFWLKQRFAA